MTNKIYMHIYFSYLDARTGLILGDSGYALKRYLMVPYLTPSNRAEENFNNALCRTRVTIEQAFGILKRRFPCLQIGYMLKCLEY